MNLIFPQKYSSMGLSKEDFNALRPKKEVNEKLFKNSKKAQIKEIFEATGIKYKIGKFEGIYKRAIEIVASKYFHISY